MNKPSFFSRIILTFSFLVTSLTILANEPAHHGSEPQKEQTVQEKNKEFIQHHLLDNHDLYLWHEEETDTYVGNIPLPIIFWDKEDGFQFGMSSEFEHGKKAVKKGSNYYVLHHEKLYKANDAAGNLSHEEGSEYPTNERPIDLSITKNVVVMLLVAILMLVLFGGMARSYKKNNGIPKGIGRFFEPIILYIRDEIAIPNIGKKHYRRYMGYLLTIFFFIWFLNIFGLTPFGVNVTNNIAVTFGLAILTFLITTFTANWNYWKHIFWMPGVPVPMKIILFPIELIGTIIKPFALMIRLFANMTAGHVVMMSLLGMIWVFKNWAGGIFSFVLAFGISIIEILVALLQAYIFTMLSSLYFGAAVEEHHHDDHH